MLCLSNSGIHPISILTKYLANLSANTFWVRTLVDPETFRAHLPAPMVYLSIWAPIIPDGVKTLSGVCPSVYPSTPMITNYLAPVLHEGSLTRQSEDGHSSLVGSVESLSCDRRSYSCLPALHDRFLGSHLWVFPLRLHPLPTRPFWIHPMQLLGIVTTLIPYPS